MDLHIYKSKLEKQIGGTINYSQIESATVYVNCYMVINNVPTTTSVSCNLKLK